MRKKYKIGLLVSVLLIVIVLSGAYYAKTFITANTMPVNPEDTQRIIVDVAPGSTPGKIAQILENQGIIRNKDVFIIYARIKGSINDFKAGKYSLGPDMNADEIIRIIVSGKTASRSFTIPEGYNLKQIAAVLVENEFTSAEEFWDTVQNTDYEYEFIEKIENDVNRLEGYLFPDTYNVPIDMHIEAIVDMMLQRFKEVYDALPESETGLDIHETVTLASIIEKESVLNAERPLIASVFLNRLKIGMKLDSDATIQYLFEEHKERVLYRDLEIDSPYNTYRNKGLPPGPIGSPGKASLLAAVQPERSEYIYFVAKKDGSGEHVFSKTFQEHINNKNILGY